MKFVLMVVFILFVLSPSYCAEKPKSCAAQVYERHLSGGEANEFFSKCTEDIKINCEISNKKLFGLQKIRALSKCIKEGMGN